jgi:hypothetical protein
MILYSDLDERSMSPITHLLISWVVADADALSKRERAIVTVAGLAPDIDGVGIVAEVLTKRNNGVGSLFSTAQ